MHALWRNMSILSFYQPHLNAGFAIYCRSGPAAMTLVSSFKLTQNCRKQSPMFLLDKYINLLLIFFKKCWILLDYTSGLPVVFWANVKDKNSQIKELLKNILAGGPCTGHLGFKERIWCFPHTHNVFFFFLSAVENLVSSLQSSSLGAHLQKPPMS